MQSLENQVGLVKEDVMKKRPVGLAILVVFLLSLVCAPFVSAAGRGFDFRVFEVMVVDGWYFGPPLAGATVWSGHMEKDGFGNDKFVPVEETKWWEDFSWTYALYRYTNNDGKVPIWYWGDFDKMQDLAVKVQYLRKGSFLLEEVITRVYSGIRIPLENSVTVTPDFSPMWGIPADTPAKATVTDTEIRLIVLGQEFLFDVQPRSYNGGPRIVYSDGYLLIERGEHWFWYWRR